MIRIRSYACIPFGIHNALWTDGNHSSPGCLFPAIFQPYRQTNFNKSAGMIWEVMKLPRFTRV